MSATLRSWRQFARKKRPHIHDLLSELHRFENPILVYGCQRSGTTMVSRLLTSSSDLTDYWFGPDDELAAAQILAGLVSHEPRGRYCFQVTYLNDQYRQLLQHAKSHKLVWVLRDPYSVVHSMLHNWSRFALSELYRHCGHAEYAALPSRFKSGLYLLWPPYRRLLRACCSYVAKLRQIDVLYPAYPAGNLYLLEYEEFVVHKTTQVPALFAFLELDYAPSILESIRASSLAKKQNMTPVEQASVREICAPVHHRIRADYLHSSPR